MNHAHNQYLKYGLLYICDEKIHIYSKGSLQKNISDTIII